MSLINYIKYRIEKYKLNKIDPEKIKIFKFSGDVYARVVSVYDCDTITIIFLYKNIVVKKSLRLENIDSPELKPPALNLNRDLEKMAANKGKQTLEHLILNKTVKVVFSDSEDKFGRLLGQVVHNKVNINEFLLLNGLARHYKGNKKIPWSDKELNLILAYKLPT